MRDLTWKFFHRWWQPKLHHVILEVEATGGTPVELSPEEWAAASARGIAIGGPDHAAGGGNGSGGMAGSIVAGAGSDFDRSHGAGASIEGLSVVTDWPTTIGESEESVPGGGSTPGKWNDVATLTGGVPSRSGNTRSSPAFPAVMEESEGSSRRRRRMDGSAPLRDHERRSPAILTAGFWLRGVELGGGSVGGLMSRVREEKHLTGVDGFSSEGGQAAQRGERNDATAANQQLSDMFSSRVSEVDGGGQEGGTPTDVSRRRSLSWVSLFFTGKYGLCTRIERGNQSVPYPGELSNKSGLYRHYVIYCGGCAAPKMLIVIVFSFLPVFDVIAARCYLPPDMSLLRIVSLLHSMSFPLGLPFLSTMQLPRTNEYIEQQGQDT